MDGDGYVFIFWIIAEDSNFFSFSSFFPQFFSGQTYSALSRATGFRGLTVKHLKESDVRVSQKVIQWYTEVFGTVC